MMLGETTGLGLPQQLSGKESACNVGDPGPIPVSGRSPGEGNGYPLFILAWRWRSLAGYIVHGILQARILEGVAIPFSRGSS